MIYEYLFEIITNGCVNYEQFINTCKLFFDINRIEKIEAYIKPKLESYIYTDIDYNECNLTDTVQYYCKKTGTIACYCGEPPQYYKQICD